MEWGKGRKEGKQADHQAHTYRIHLHLFLLHGLLRGEHCLHIIVVEVRHGRKALSSWWCGSG